MIHSRSSQRRLPALPGAWHSQHLPCYKNTPWGGSLLLCSGKQQKGPCGESLDSLLLRPPPPPQEGPQAVPHLGVHQGAHEDEGSAQPVPACEGILEVQDGEDEADELAERHHQGDREGRALRGQDEDAADADVPGSRR